MLDSHMDTLGDDSLSHLLVHNHSDRSRVDVENSTSSAVVVLVRHALVDGSVNHNVNDVTNFVSGESLGDVDGSVLLESLSEFVTDSSLVAVSVGHGIK